MGLFGFSQKRLEPEVSPWQQHRRCHSVSFVMYISGAKFEEHCSDISGDILYFPIPHNALCLPLTQDFHKL